MAAKVYVSSVSAPEYDYKNGTMESYEKTDDKYIKDVEANIRKMGYNDEYTGKIIKFGVADGYAEYMVAKIKPLILVHLEIGDAWNFQYAHLLTATEVKKKIKNQEEFDKLFSKK